MANWLVVKKKSVTNSANWIEMVSIPDMALAVIDTNNYDGDLHFHCYDASNSHNAFNHKMAAFEAYNDEAIDAIRQFCRQFSKTGDKYAKVVEFLKEHNITL